MTPRRVAYFINTLDRGGTQRNVAMLCQHMDRTRYQPQIWTLRPGGEFEEVVRAAGVEVHCLGRSGSYDPRFALSAARRIARFDVDLFHVFLPAIMFYVGLSRLVFRAKQPVVYSEPATSRSHPWLWPMQSWLLRTQGSGFAANSSSSRDFLAGQGVPKEAIRIIPNGHDSARFNQPIDRDAARASLGLGADDRLAIFVGRLIETKRVCDLVEGVRQLGAARGRLRVGLVGDGPCRQELERQVLQAGLVDVVQFMGERSDVPALLQSADLFVFPSETEGLSNAVIEAALAGLPIVGCDVGGVNDVIADGREGLLVPPRDPAALAAAIQRYLEDPKFATSQGQAARNRASQAYAVENTLAKIYELYDQVLSTGS
jgi:glycosyltransferase involved in cell wall biosynthesis